MELYYYPNTDTFSDDKGNTLSKAECEQLWSDTTSHGTIPVNMALLTVINLNWEMDRVREYYK